MALSKSKIDYLTHVWNFQTGCLNQEQGVCKLPCWAKAQAKRFGRSFEPELHLVKLTDTLPKEPARIGVCFTGDLFGDWVDPDILASPYATLKDLVHLKVECARSDGHQFFFLTKCPWNLHKWGRFPDNAWVGASINNDVMLTQTFSGMYAAQAKNKWLSIEPLLSWGMEPEDFRWTLRELGISWVVIGAQTHPNIQPRPEWVREIIEACDAAKIPVFLKANLWDGLYTNAFDDDIFWATDKAKLRQELPKQEGE